MVSGTPMATGDGIQAWTVLRRLEDYEAAWRAHAGPPAALEPGPFPIRVQGAADLEAARFDLLAWADPRAGDGPASPFWVQDGMAEAALAPGVAPLASVVAEGGGSIEGLRLRDGALVLKIECGPAALQLRVRGAGPFPDAAGIELRHPFGLGMPQTVRRLIDFWSVAGRAVPPETAGPDPRGRRAGTCSR